LLSEISLSALQSDKQMTINKNQTVNNPMPGTEQNQNKIHIFLALFWSEDAIARYKTEPNSLHSQNPPNSTGQDMILGPCSRF